MKEKDLVTIAVTNVDSELIGMEVGGKEYGFSDTKARNELTKKENKIVYGLVTTDEVQEIETLNNIPLVDKTAREHLETIANELGRNTDGTEIDMGTTATNVRGAIKELKDNQGGGVTQEQIDSAVTSYLNANPVTGGLTTTAKNLLITILRNAMYTTNQSNNITLLESALASSESGGDTPVVTTYTITNNLTNCVNSNVNTSVSENSSYVANITANEGYTLDSVVVTMGGTDITSTVYSEGSINISSVTGDIVITASASEKSSVDELPTDGLVDYFDFRNISPTTGSGGLYYIPATIGNGMVYSWSSGGLGEISEYGLKMSGIYTKEKSTGYPVNTIVPNGDFTLLFFGKSWVSNLSWISRLIGNGFYSVIKYKNTSGENISLDGKGIDLSNSIFNFIAYTISEDSLKLYINGKLVQEVNATELTDFSNWNRDISISTPDRSEYATAFAVYDRVLTEVELIEAEAFFRTLEVTA